MKIFPVKMILKNTLSMAGELEIVYILDARHQDVSQDVKEAGTSASSLHRLAV